MRRPALSWLVLTTLGVSPSMARECVFLFGGDCPELRQMHRDWDVFKKRREEHEEAMRNAMAKAEATTSVLFEPSKDVEQAGKRRLTRLQWLAMLKKQGREEKRRAPGDQKPGFRWANGDVTPGYTPEESVLLRGLSSTSVAPPRVKVHAD